MRKIPLYVRLARAIEAYRRCVETKNDEWLKRWRDDIDELVNEFPSGAGFDNGWRFSPQSSVAKLMFNTDFHHMNDNGCYDGWTEHTITVTPVLDYGFELKISGRNRNGIKELIADVVDEVLRREIDEFTDRTNKKTEAL